MTLDKSSVLQYTVSMINIRNLSPERMTNALLEAALAERGDHWEHEVKVHAGDWMRTGYMPRPLTAEQFARLPELVARYQFVKLCVYSYRKRVVWAYYCRKLPFEGYILKNVLVIFDPETETIIHCMSPRKGERYCLRWGKQEKLFVKVR